MIYTQEQLDTAIFNSNNVDEILITLNDIKSEVSDIKSEVKGQFYLTVGLIIGIYGIIGAVFLAKIYEIL